MTSQALIPYSHCQSTNALNVDVRVFDLNGLLIKINQNWKADGRGGTKIGFGASIYDCSYVLLDYLQNNVEIIRGKSVLEFGCGTGFVSIAVSMLGAGLTIVTDGDEGSIELTNENIVLNKSFLITNAESGVSKIVATKLYWGDEEDESRVQHILYEWNTIKSGINTHDGQSFTADTSANSLGDNNSNTASNINTVFNTTDTATVNSVNHNNDSFYPDFIIASDIAAVPYAAAYQTLVDTLMKMSNKNTTVILAYQRRHLTEDDFFALLRERFEVERLPRSVIHKDFRHMPIFLFKCKLL